MKKLLSTFQVMAVWLSFAVANAEDLGFFLTVGGINGEKDGHKVEGEFGTIYSSTDGENWTKLFKGGPVKADFNHANNNMLRCLTYGNGRFVATGNPKGIVTSTDGKKWESIPTSQGGMSVEFGNGVFLAPNAYGFMRSADGLTWEVVKPEVDFKIWGADGAGHVRKTVFGNGVFVCIGEQRLGVTKDGSAWIHHELFPKAEGPGRNALLFGKGRFVLLSTNWGVKTSVDGITWEKSSLNELHTGEGKFGLNGVFDGTYFWAAAPVWKEESKRLYHSPDGLKWKIAAEGKDSPSITTAGNGLLLANVGHAKSFRFSADGGKTWKEAKVNIGSRVVYFFDGKRIVGQSGG